MTILKFNVDSSPLGAASPVPVPVGTPVPVVRTFGISPANNARTRTGVWECSPGRFRRQVKQAEFSHFLSGECSFTPDGGETLEIRPGDALFFPPNSNGVWEIRKTTRKVFMVFDEGAAPAA
ncbi:MAG: cupin domain-containing protein [Proteobacteria bacterium]|nr:cupin domain-containing protein [Pseudomonadota bacterium]